MPVIDPNTVGATPWYKSSVQISLIASFVSAFIALFPKVGATLGLNTSDEVNSAVTTVFSFIAIIAPVVGGVFRAKSTIQPLTLTQAKADNHPATVVAEANAEAKKP